MQQYWRVHGSEEKAVKGHCSSRCRRVRDVAQHTRSVLDCANPLALSKWKFPKQNTKSW